MWLVRDVNVVLGCNECVLLIISGREESVRFILVCSAQRRRFMWVSTSFYHCLCIYLFWSNCNVLTIFTVYSTWVLHKMCNIFCLMLVSPSAGALWREELVWGGVFWWLLHRLLPTWYHDPVWQVSRVQICIDPISNKYEHYGLS